MVKSYDFHASWQHNNKKPPLPRKADISVFWFPFSFDTFTCTFRSSDYEVCICTALKCPWVVLGFKVPGRQTQQPHQQRLLQSGIWQRQNGSYVSESLGAASWYCGNCRLFAFVLYYGYCSVCLPITSVVITVIFQAIERCVVVSLQSFFLSFLFDCTPKWIPFRKLSVASRKYFSFRPLRCSSSVNLFCSVWSQVNNLTHLFARVRWNKSTLYCSAISAKPQYLLRMPVSTSSFREIAWDCYMHDRYMELYGNLTKV